MVALLNKFRLRSKELYSAIILVVLMSFLYYPYTVGSGKAQRVVTPIFKSVPKLSRVDSLKIRLTFVDSALNKNCTTLIRQQDTFKRIIKKQTNDK